MTAFASLSKRLLAVAALGACTLAQAQAPAAPSPAFNARIGWVSTERLFSESKLAKAADAKIEAEFSKRQKAIAEMAEEFQKTSEKFDKEAANMSEADRTRKARELIDMDKDLQRKQREFQIDLNQRKNEERATISGKAYKLIQQIAEQEKLDLVLQEAAWYSNRIDITDRLIKQLDK